MFYNLPGFLSTCWYFSINFDCEPWEISCWCAFSLIFRWMYNQTNCFDAMWLYYVKIQYIYLSYDISLIIVHRKRSVDIRNNTYDYYVCDTWNCYSIITRFGKPFSYIHAFDYVFIFYSFSFNFIGQFKHRLCTQNFIFCFK